MDTGSVRLVLRHLTFGGAEAVQSAVASDCAAEQGHFLEYYEALFEDWDGRTLAAFTESNYARLAGSLGLDLESFRSCMSSGRSVTELQRDLDDAGELGVDAVPTIFINGRRLVGELDYENYQGIIEEELQKAKDQAGDGG